MEVLVLRLNEGGPTGVLSPLFLEASVQEGIHYAAASRLRAAADKTL